MTKPNRASTIQTFLPRLQPHMSVRQYGTGHIIHGPTTPSHHFHIILSGGVRFANVTPEGQDLDMFVMRAPDSFGDISLLSGLPPPHMAVVETPSQIGLVNREAFLALIDREKPFRDWLFWRLSYRLASAYMALDGLRSETSEQRILRYLNWLQASGFAEGDDETRFRLTQAELASRLGLSRTTVSATLKQLEKGGVIRRGYGYIELGTENRN